MVESSIQMRDYSTAFSFILDGIMQKKKEIVIVNPFKLNRKKWMEEKVEDCEKISSREAKKKTQARGNEVLFFLSAHLICFALVQNKWGAEREAK